MGQRRAGMDRVGDRRAMDPPAAAAGGGGVGGGKYFRPGVFYIAPDELILQGITAGAGPATGTLWIWGVGPFAEDCTINLFGNASSAGTQRKYGIWRSQAATPMEPTTAELLHDTGAIDHPTNFINPDLDVSAGDFLFMGITYSGATDAYMINPRQMAARFGFVIPSADSFGIVGFTKAHAFGGALPDPLGAVSNVTWETNVVRPILYFQVA